MGRSRRTRYAPRATVQVTQHEIDTAVPRDSGHCMIADAVKRAIPHAKGISVDLQSIRFTDREKNLRYTFLTPRSAQLALLDFDAGRKPEPFAFQLRGAMVTNAHIKQAPKDPVVAGAARLADLSPETVAKGSVPVRVGGKVPPVGPLSNRPRGIRVGKRREFGLRALMR